jgi:hypothetical protein
MRTIRALAIAALLLSCALSALAADLTILNGTIQTWHSGASTLANNATVTSAAVTLTNAGYPKATCELNMPAPSGTVAANTNVAVWFRLDPDGTNFEDAASPRLPDFTFPLAASAGAQRISVKDITLPAQAGFQVVIKNNGTGVTINTTWTLKCVPYTQRLQ